MDDPDDYSPELLLEPEPPPPVAATPSLRALLRAVVTNEELTRMMRLQVKHACAGDTAAFRAVLAACANPASTEPAEPEIDYYGIFDFGDGKPLHLPHYRDGKRPARRR